MSKYYILGPDPGPEYRLNLILPPDLQLDEQAIRRGQAQFINDVEELFTVEGPPRRLPDLSWQGIPLISEAFREVLNEAGVTNIFYKPIILEARLKYHQYYLPVVRAIACVDWHRNQYETVGPEDDKRITGGFAVDGSKTGNFKIFRIQDVINDFWIIDEELKTMIVAADVTGVTIIDTVAYQE